MTSPDTSAAEVVAWRVRQQMYPETRWGRWSVYDYKPNWSDEPSVEYDALVSKSTLDLSRAETAAANARADALVAALKPFAEAATGIERVYGDIPDHQLQFLPLAMSEFRAARRALTEIEGKSQ